MKKNFLTAVYSLSLLFFVSPAQAQDKVLKAMEDEMNRTVSKLKIANYNTPYFVSYYVAEASYSYVSASFGDFKSFSSNFSRSGKADIRVGGRNFDNTAYISNFRDYKPAYTSLSADDDYDSIRKSLWILSDNAYKIALEKYAQKMAYSKKKDIKEIYGDLSQEKPVKYLGKNKACGAFDGEKMKLWIKDISKVFKKYPNISDSDVSASFSRIVKRFVNSEGSSYTDYSCEFNVVLQAETQNKEGFKISDSKQFNYPDIKPEYLAAIEKKAQEYAFDINEAYDAEKLDYYVGPALIEDEAAGEFFNQLFVRNISFNPKPWADKDESLKYYYDIPKLKDRVGKRILPGFINVYDNPLISEYGGIGLSGAYDIDNEAVKPEKLSLVEKGKLLNLYASRKPDENYPKSNGRGRGKTNSFIFASASNVFIESEKKMSKEELIKKIIEMGREQQLDFVIVIKKVNRWKTSDSVMGDPVLAYKLNLADGKRTPLNLSKFDGMGLRALRDISLVSDSNSVYNFYQSDPFYTSGASVATSIICPESVLVSEIEIKKTDKKTDKKPYLPHPFFAK